MRYKFYTSSFEVWQAMYGAISQAKKSVYLEMYIFVDDVKKFDFIKILKEKAEEGVDVRLVLDSLGSVSLSKRATEDLRASGIEVLFLSHFWYRMHRKILVIDETVAFIGGVNIHESSMKWKDLAVKIRGGDLVRYIVSIFAKDYEFAGGKNEYVLSKKITVGLPEKVKNKFKKVKENFFEHFPAMRKFLLQKMYKDRLAKAEKEVFLITPYFAPKRSLVSTLHQTVLRGVDVKVLVPVHTEEWFFDKANYFYMTRCTKLGIKFFLMPEMNHSKAMLVDRREAMVGSQNLDFLSSNMNAEVGVFFNNKKAVSELESIVLGWQRESEPFDPNKYALNWWENALAHFFNFFVMLL